mmetsp:Transcript_59364/g.173633  ORF Transcript_59364/g.173633 Transcript_59364/m.173633 type:complete len:280 (+) Transcript_59364:939-1778(+)
MSYPPGGMPRKGTPSSSQTARSSSSSEQLLVKGSECSGTVMFSSWPCTESISRPSASGTCLRSQRSCASGPGGVPSHNETLRSKTAWMTRGTVSGPSNSPRGGDMPRSSGGWQPVWCAQAAQVTEELTSCVCSSQRSSRVFQWQPRGDAAQEQASNVAPQTAAAQCGCTGQDAQLTLAALRPKALWQLSVVSQEQPGARAQRQGEAQTVQESTGSGVTVGCAPPKGGAVIPVVSEVAGKGGIEVVYVRKWSGRRTRITCSTGVSAVISHSFVSCDRKRP